ncbi:hypothetical protein AAKU55_005197 [Oxalobacteraceae bacterium GrIS 1.11]
MRHLSILLLLGCSACGISQSAPQSAPQAASGTLGQIHALIGAAPCTGSAQCATLALGAKSCGGPEFYLAWSTANTTAPKLAALAARFQGLRQAEDAASGAMSDCRMVSDPGAVCQKPTGADAGKCVLRAPEGGRAD